MGNTQPILHKHNNLPKDAIVEESKASDHLEDLEDKIKKNNELVKRHKLNPNKPNKKLVFK